MVTLNRADPSRATCFVTPFPYRLFADQLKSIGRVGSESGGFGALRPPQIRDSQAGRQISAFFILGVDRYVIFLVSAQLDESSTLASQEWGTLKFNVKGWPTRQIAQAIGEAISSDTLEAIVRTKCRML
jgi:hypothetical protein